MLSTVFVVPPLSCDNSFAGQLREVDLEGFLLDAGVTLEFVEIKAIFLG
jgi:hypothetical protein